MQEVGKVTHYFGKIGVAIVELSDGIKVGDKIKVEGKHTEFEQAVDSLEVEHKPVTEASRGDVVGMKVVERVSEGAKVYKLEG
jgi:putative protease